MDLKQIMNMFSLLLGLMLSAHVGVVSGQTPIPTPTEVPMEDDGNSGSGDKPENEPYCDEVSGNYQGYCWDRNVGDPTVYCDQVDPDELGPNKTCHDRKDTDDDTGLYTCLDGSHEEDWRDCKGGGAHEDESDEEETENCGGEPCTPSEKEDSWLEDDTEYGESEEVCYENDDGALGDPIPC
jgi:hypothetical protein